ncbi:MAG: 23S rRNA (uracil(1939)-C(5))-methyltransferase RlmD [Coriobacteriales bacterium]|nr:23S rRNA (uracil(1939)-C(5))-methyltransferase RlmD [Coriobacteriales bacterium]
MSEERTAKNTKKQPASYVKKSKPKPHKTNAPSNAQEKTPRCPVSKRCGGCEWLRMPYDMQLARKQAYVEELYSDYRVTFEPIIGMDNPYYYRNKVQLPFAPAVFGKQPSNAEKPKNSRPAQEQQNRKKPLLATWGIFERGSHKIVPCDACLVEDQQARPIISQVAELITKYDIAPYNEDLGAGFLRYCLVRTAHATGQVMLTLICNGNKIPQESRFIEDLLKRCPSLTTVVLNENRDRTSVILGKQERILYGKGFIEDVLCGCTFRISSSSFYQINAIQAEKLYAKAIDLARLSPHDRIGDAYCGTGTIGIVAAHLSGASLLGVERNPDAVENARENALLNGIENARFIAGDAGSVFAHMARAGEPLDVVFMDPPRVGSTQAFLANLCKLAPQRIVYISCEPKTQHRDISWLVHHGYRLKTVASVDMFPHTDHVETVCLLSKLSDAKHHISVQVDMDELDLTAAESKATYEEIQEWVQVKYGFHVTHLNIAQVKRKHGIIERKNYNKPKSPDSKQPKCPEEKVKAIEEAMKHFQMI